MCVCVCACVCVCVCVCACAHLCMCVFVCAMHRNLYGTVLRMHVVKHVCLYSIRYL